MAQHNFRSSAYALRKNNQYFTEHWCTQALFKGLADWGLEPDLKKPVWDPCAGQGDILLVAQEFGYDTIATDLDTSNWNHDLGSIEQADFLQTYPDFDSADLYSAIITNPPFTGRVPYDGKSMYLAEACIRHSLTFGIGTVAHLVRTDFNHSARRKDLWTHDDYVGEIILTSRPRWDWWYEKDPWEESKSPMHNYVWHVWSKNMLNDGSETYRNQYLGPADLGIAVQGEEDEADSD